MLHLYKNEDNCVGGRYTSFELVILAKEMTRYLSPLADKLKAVPRVGWRVCVGWSLIMHDLMLAMLSLTKMCFDSLRVGAFPRVGCSPALRSLLPCDGQSL